MLPLSRGEAVLRSHYSPRPDFGHPKRKRGLRTLKTCPGAQILYMSQGNQAAKGAQ